jgi:hypothetical protein
MTMMMCLCVLACVLTRGESKYCGERDRARPITAPSVDARAARRRRGAQLARAHPPPTASRAVAQRSLSTVEHTLSHPMAAAAPR